MKKYFSVALLFLIVSAQAKTFAPLKWSELEMNHSYSLSQDVAFDVSNALLKKGEQLEVVDFIQGEVPVFYYQLHRKNCTNQNQISEMVLVNPSPDDTTRDHSVGVQLESGCNVGLYLEISDFESESLFN